MCPHSLHSDLKEMEDDGLLKMHMKSVFQENGEGTGTGEILFIYRYVAS